MTLKNIYSRVPQHLLEKLSAFAEMRQLSTSEMIRGIITQFFECVDDSQYSQPNLNLRKLLVADGYDKLEPENLEPDIDQDEYYRNDDDFVEIDW